MWPCTSKDDFIRTLFTKGHRPVRLPTSFGPGLLVGITRCCGHMPTGVLWVICVLFGHGVAIYRTCTLKVPLGSRASTLGTPPPAPVDSIRAWEHPCVQFCSSVRTPCGLGNIRTISGAGPYGVRWSPRVHARVIFAKPNTIMWHLTR